MQGFASRSALLLSFLAVAGCATPEPTFTQHSYRELNFPPNFSVGVLGADPQAVPGELPHFYPDPEGIETIASFVQQQNAQRNRAAYLNSPEGRSTLMAEIGLPYLSERSRARIGSVRVIPAARDRGITLATSLGDITDISLGAALGAEAGLFAADEITAGSDCTTRGSSGFALMIETLCGLFYVGAYAAATIGGGIIGGMEAAEAQREEEQRRLMLQTVRENIGDVRPLATLVAAIETELKAAGIDRGYETSASPGPTVPPARPRFRSEGEAIAWQKDTNGAASLSRLLAGDNRFGTGLGINIQNFGLYPLVEDDRVVYSLAAIVDFAFAVPQDAVRTVHRDEIRLGEYTLMTRRLPIVMPAHPLSEWVADGAGMLADELETMNGRLAQRIVDTAIRLYRTEDETFTPKKGPPIRGAGTYRLAAVSPAPEILDFGDDLAWALNPFAAPNQLTVNELRHANACNQVQASSAHPTFSWEATPVSAGGSPLPQEVVDLRYDLRIFDDGLREVYRADDIRGPNHRLEHALSPGGHYYWTVRASFDLDGDRRVTDWAICGRSATPFPYLDDLPVREFYPFSTPRADNSG